VYCNGHITPYDITISQAKKNADDDVVSMIQARMPGIFSLYDNSERIRELGKYMLLSRMYQLWTSDKRFVQKVHFLLKSPSIDNILLLSDDSLWAFIAGVFDTDGDFKHFKGKVYAARLYPAIDEHEVRVMIYALRRLGVYARINKRRKDEVQVIQITGEDLLRFVEGIKKYSVKAKHEIASTNNSNSIVTNNKSVKRGVERVIKVERVPYDGYVYDLSVGEYHNYEVSLVYVHNCIDELDKMRQEDRSALHEVMEQQTCSVAKGGIVATLNARTSILAAANPILGKYDPYRNITENINLPIPLLTRFDLIFAIRDEPNKDADAQLARHILGIHRRAGYERLPYINIDMLRKYLAYAKRVNPVLSREAEDKIFEYYMQMRASASPDAITITARQLEALIRLATARARLLLKSIVDVSDAERAIHIFNVMLNKVGIDVKTGKVDLGVLHGMPQSERSKMKLFLDIFNALSGKDQNPVEEQALITELVKTGKFTEDDAKEWINKAKLNGMIYEVRQGFYKRT
jgi:MoxR-like ATPase